MADLNRYIKTALDKGMTDVEIKAMLIKVGWKESIIDNTMRENLKAMPNSTSKKSFFRKLDKIDLIISIYYILAISLFTLIFLSNPNVNSINSNSLLHTLHVIRFLPFSLLNFGGGPAGLIAFPFGLIFVILTYFTFWVFVFYLLARIVRRVIGQDVNLLLVHLPGLLICIALTVPFIIFK